MNTALSRAEALTLFTISAACIGVIANTFQGDGEPLIASLAFSGIAFASTYCMIRWLGEAFMKAGLKGKDMSKVKKVEMYVHTKTSNETLICAEYGAISPETMGAVCAVVYLLIIIVFIPFPFYKDIVAATSGGGNKDVLMERQHIEIGRTLHRFPHNRVS